MSNRTYRIAVVPGDGIGPEVTREALKVLECVCGHGGPALEFKEYPYSADHFLETGVTLPDETLAEWRELDAVFMGAFGDLQRGFLNGYGDIAFENSEFGVGTGASPFDETECRDKLPRHRQSTDRKIVNRSLCLGTPQRLSRYL